jgi:competence ComEA-like helix-hairpin-helix protein
VAWPRAAQRVLLVVAAALALGAYLGGKQARRPIAVRVADDPSLDVRLDLNRATPADLETLPGVGKALAEKISAHRDLHGPFGSVEELLLVPGCSEKLLQALRPYLIVGVADRQRGGRPGD